MIKHKTHFNIQYTVQPRTYTYSFLPSFLHICPLMWREKTLSCLTSFDLRKRSASSLEGGKEPDVVICCKLLIESIRLHETEHSPAQWSGEGSARSRGEGLSGPYAQKQSQFGWKVITAETGALWDAETKGLVFLQEVTENAGGSGESWVGSLQNLGSGVQCLLKLEQQPW